MEDHDLATGDAGHTTTITCTRTSTVIMTVELLIEGRPLLPNNAFVSLSGDLPAGSFGRVHLRIHLPCISGTEHHEKVWYEGKVSDEQDESHSMSDLPRGSQPVLLTSSILASWFVSHATELREHTKLQADRAGFARKLASNTEHVPSVNC